MTIQPSRGRRGEATAAARRTVRANIRGQTHPARVGIQNAFHR
jgi:hypothetical protein